MGIVIHSILLKAPTQAKLLDLCTLNLRFLFCLVNQKDDKGILNSTYAHKIKQFWITIPTYYFLFMQFFSQLHLQSLFYLFTLTIFAPLVLVDNNYWRNYMHWTEYSNTSVDYLIKLWSIHVSLLEKIINNFSMAPVYC